ncbi:UNVERIFIED_CONTAM: hypothetical protein Scaly_1738900 [Sesamum calycinum]|uniref:Reverse transcriptase zinc-binding domain-containing protein n=1 Tax=Sesamum calycinum TaxID=2727403 RepID=A0AAW2NX57_9LAMI
MREFRLALDNAGLFDLGCSDGVFTWCDRQEAPHTILERLDRVCGNDNWQLQFPHTQRNIEACRSKLLAKKSISCGWIKRDNGKIEKKIEHLRKQTITLETRTIENNLKAELEDYTPQRKYFGSNEQNLIGLKKGIGTRVSFRPMPAKPSIGIKSNICVLDLRSLAVASSHPRSSFEQVPAGALEMGVQLESRLTRGSRGCHRSAHVMQSVHRRLVLQFVTSLDLLLAIGMCPYSHIFSIMMTGVWNYEVPNKIRGFAWQLGTDSLPLGANLVKRIPGIDVVCPLCPAPEESDRHTFILCSFARIV